MKFLLTLIFLVATLGVQAETITVTVTVEEIKAVEAIVVDAQDWLQKAWEGKANKCINRVFEEISDKQANKVDKKTKKALIKSTTIKTRVEKDLENN